MTGRASKMMCFISPDDGVVSLTAMNFRSKDHRMINVNLHGALRSLQGSGTYFLSHNPAMVGTNPWSRRFEGYDTPGYYGGIPVNP